MFFEKVIQVTNDLEVPFNVRIFEEDGKRKVAFYDARYDHTEYGQFIASYYADTIARHSKLLFLDLEIENWQVSARNMEEIHQALKEVGI
jgi:hypothetical protein